MRFQHPVSNTAGVPCFGCHACAYSRHGCDACLRGPPVRNAYKPAEAIHHDVPSVPVYYPTEEEWAGDPLSYINSIRPEAEKYGVCNIVAPESWRPEFRLPNKDKLRFRTRVQAVNELQNRPAGPSKRARENEAKAKAALEAAGLSLPARVPPRRRRRRRRTHGGDAWVEAAVVEWAAAQTPTLRQPPRPRPRPGPPGRARGSREAFAEEETTQ